MSEKNTDDNGADGQDRLFGDTEIPEVPPPGKRLVCTPTVKLKNGRLLYAHAYGKKAFCFYVNA